MLTLNQPRLNWILPRLVMTPHVSHVQVFPFRLLRGGRRKIIFKYVHCVVRWSGMDHVEITPNPPMPVRLIIPLDIEPTLPRRHLPVSKLLQYECHRGRPLVGFPCFSLQPKRPRVLIFGMVPAGLEPSTGLLGLVGHLGVVSWSKG